MSAPECVVLIRHGEKPGQDGPPHGVNHHGVPDEHSLSVRGWTRAGALAAVMARVPHPAVPALPRPARIFATRPTHADRSTRERDTAMPSALRLGLTIDDSIPHGEEAALAAAVLAADTDALVVWHHGELSTLARSFPVVNAHDIPAAWPEDRFDLYWILTAEPGTGDASASGPSYRFSIAPQLLLDGDQG